MSQQMDATGKVHQWAVSWGGTSFSGMREGLGEDTSRSFAPMVQQDIWDHPQEERSSDAA